MELGPATETFVLELRCLEDGGPGPGTLSGEGLEGGGSDLKQETVLRPRGGRSDRARPAAGERGLQGGGQPAVLSARALTCGSGVRGWCGAGAGCSRSQRPSSGAWSDTGRFPSGFSEAAISGCGCACDGLPDDADILRPCLDPGYVLAGSCCYFPSGQEASTVPQPVPGSRLKFSRLNSGALSHCALYLRHWTPCFSFLCSLLSPCPLFLTSASNHLPPLLPRGKYGPAEPFKMPSPSGTRSGETFYGGHAPGGHFPSLCFEGTD